MVEEVEVEERADILLVATKKEEHVADDKPQASQYHMTATKRKRPVDEEPTDAKIAAAKDRVRRFNARELEIIETMSNLKQELGKIEKERKQTKRELASLLSITREPNGANAHENQGASR